MQTRTSFNGGEQSLELAARVDVDSYMRGCRVLENWMLSPMGGVKRRRGMRHFAALGEAEQDARLFPYIYTYSGDGGRYLVAVSGETVRVFDVNGQIQQVCNASGDESDAFYSAENGNFRIDVETARARQINSILMIVSAWDMPLKLQFEPLVGWTLERYEFKIPPWRFENELRDEPIVVQCHVDPETKKPSYVMDFSEVTDDLESTPFSDDTLRLSYYTKQKEAFRLMNDLIENVQVRTADDITPAARGTCVAVPDEMTIKYFVCKKAFPSSVYCDGLALPANYPDNFEEAADVSKFSNVSVFWSVKAALGGSDEMSKGTKFGIRMGYWRYFTCIKEFTAEDIVSGVNDYGAYGEFFREGLAIGEAIPCRGAWQFWCSGVWYGSYKVLRNYETSAFDSGEWEDVAVSFSRNAGAENNIITGDESDEACYLQLVLTRSRRIATDSLRSGFPSDSCGNRLIVESYRHDFMLDFTEVVDTSTGATTHEWRCRDKVKDTWYGNKRVYNWSWRAFSSRYGYPRLCEVFDQRLVFGSTDAQPQSLWFSRTDDLNNFSSYEGDDSAIAVTLATTTQNPICWIQSHAARLCLGTCESEFVVTGTSSGGAALTPANIMVQRHGHIGSDENLSLVAADKVLFIERGGGRCYDYGYSYEVDGFRSSDLTVLAPHILSEHGGAVDCTLLRKPDTVAVFALADGQVALCTYVPMQQVNAWHRWVTDGQVRSVCALPNGTASDRLFLVVERDGERAIEVVDDDSPFFDGHGDDYVSTLISNATFNAMEAPVGLRKTPAVGFLFGVDAPVENMQICSDGGVEWTSATHSTPTLPAGWHKLVTISNWSYENKIGFRVWGDNDASLLALQG